jgi:hypothetical protein
LAFGFYLTYWLKMGPRWNRTVLWAATVISAILWFLHTSYEGSDGCFEDSPEYARHPAETEGAIIGRQSKLAPERGKYTQTDFGIRPAGLVASSAAEAENEPGCFWIQVSSSYGLRLNEGVPE